LTGFERLNKTPFTTRFIKNSINKFMYNSLMLFDYYTDSILFIIFVKRDFFLDAVFLWRTPFVAALSRYLNASERAFAASGLSFVETAVLNRLTAVFVRDFTILFLKVFLAIIFILFFADLTFANMIHLLMESVKSISSTNFYQGFDKISIII